MAESLLNGVTFILADRSIQLREAWEAEFSEKDHVLVSHEQDGDFFEPDADAMVSPANCFGYMDGGIDNAIRKALKYDVEYHLQSKIVELDTLTLPIGDSIILKVPSKVKWRYLISAPTMYTPGVLNKGSRNAYLSFRAVLKQVLDHNMKSDNTQSIKSVVCPGMGTGIGQMPPIECARQMREAYEDVVGAGGTKKDKKQEAERKKRKAASADSKLGKRRSNR